MFEDLLSQWLKEKHTENGWFASRPQMAALRAFAAWLDVRLSMRCAYVKLVSQEMVAFVPVTDRRKINEMTVLGWVAYGDGVDVTKEGLVLWPCDGGTPFDD